MIAHIPAIGFLDEVAILQSSHCVAVIEVASLHDSGLPLCMAYVYFTHGPQDGKSVYQFHTVLDHHPTSVHPPRLLYAPAYWIVCRFPDPSHATPRELSLHELNSVALSMTPNVQ
jgi:hypothetical protein